MPAIAEDKSKEQCLVKNHQFAKKGEIQKLLLALNQNPVLYNPQNSNFGNIEAKNTAWENIANVVNADVALTRNAWFKYRYKLQKQIRSSKKAFTFKKKYNLNKCIQHTKATLVLKKFIKPINGTDLPYIVEETANTETANNEEKDNDVEIVDDAPEIIDLDNEDYEYDNFKITAQMKVLIDLVHVYGEIYNSQHRYYYDYKRKGNIWCAIANEIGDKATKLLKLWIYIEIRFEWEIEYILRVPTARATELTKLLWFLKPCYQKNNYSVYKQSHFLKKQWYEPIKSFKELVQFLRLIKVHTDVVHVTEYQLHKKVTNDSVYIEKWQIISKACGMSAGVCEITWLTLRAFYYEIFNMRKQGYLFQDKWFFETTIADILKTTPKFNITRSITKSTPPIVTEESNEEEKSTSTENFTFVNVTSINSNNLPAKQPTTQVTLGSGAPLKIIPIPKPNGNNTQNQRINQTSALISKFFANEVNNEKNTITVNKNTTTVNKNTTTVNKNTTTVNKNTTTLNKNIATVDKNATETIAFGPEDFVPCADSSINTTNQESSTLEATVNTYRASQAEAGLARCEVLVPQDNPQPNVVETSSKTSNGNGQLSTNTDVSNNLSYQIPIDTNLKITKVVSLHTLTPQLKISNVTSLNTSISSGNVATANESTNLIQPVPAEIVNNLNEEQTPTVNVVNVPLTDGEYKENLNPNYGNWNSIENPTILDETSEETAPKDDENQIRVSKRTTLQTIPLDFNDEVTELTATTELLNDSAEVQIDVEQVVKETAKNAEPASKSDSSLNSNEIIIELVSSAKGNQLLVHGPPLAGNDYQLSMEQVAYFIREIMAIPQLHTRTETNPFFWHHISKSCDLPANICKACWNFLSENFNHFHHFAPMHELMKPFKTELNVWKIRYELFRNFDDAAVYMGWLKYRDVLLDLVSTISTYPKWFINHKFGNDIKYAQTWTEIHKIYPQIPDVMNIWKAFRDVFWIYIMQLEKGIENKWPQNWWKILYRMKFLVIERYSINQPFYYIVRNKIEEEAHTCRLLEFKNPGNEIKDGNELVHPIDVYELSNAVRKNSSIYLSNFSQEEKHKAWQAVSQALGKDVEYCKGTFKKIYRHYKAYRAADPYNVCAFNRSYYKILHDIDKNANLKLKIRTPMELNQTILDPPIEANKMDTEEKDDYWPNKHDNKFGVLENIIDELGKFPTKVQDELEYELTELFKKYEKLN